MINHDERVEAAGRERTALIGAVVAGDLTATVPTCPEWTVANLAVHVGQVCGFWADVLRTGSGTVRASYPGVPVDDPSLVDWLRERADELVATMAATPSDTAVSTTHFPDQSAAVAARRCAHELAVHRYDAQSARGTCQPIAPPSLAIDGIDELVGTLVNHRISGEGAIGGGSGRTIHLHGTDEGVAGAEWLLTLHGDRVEVAHVHAKGDLALRGSVSDLELLLYGRPTLGSVQRFGDETVLDTWYRIFKF